MGTRFIATTECTASDAYKRAIVEAREGDIVLTERLSGVPVAVINTKSVQRLGTRVSPLARWMFRGRRTKKWMRSYYGLRSMWGLRRSLRAESAGDDYWQAGKSVECIDAVTSTGDVVRACATAWRERATQHT